MSLVDLVMPKLGESIMEATILKWLKQPGDKVAQDETVLEIATDKVDSEVPSTAEGILEEVLYKENDVVPIGKVIARIKVGVDSDNWDNRPAEPPRQSHGASEQYEEAKIMEEIPYQPIPNKQQATANANTVRFYSPLVLNIAANEGVAMSELENIPGTGQDGRVSKKDILEYIAGRKAAGYESKVTSYEPRAASKVHPQSTQAVMISENQLPETQSSQLVSYSGNVEVIEMDRMRKMIAKHMIDSQNTSAHVTSFAEFQISIQFHFLQLLY